jgi:hypothetical protein
MSVKDEAWKFPDGSQLSYTALAQMGKTPGDIGEIMQQLFRNRNKETMENLGVKGTALLERTAETDNNTTFLDKQRQQNDQFNEERRQEQLRMDEQHRLAEQRQQEDWQKKKDADEAFAAKNRPQEDALNSRIMGLPLGLASFGLGLGLTRDALDSVGGRAADSVGGLNSPMMVASNNGGGLLAMARGLLGMDGPGAGKDFLLKGPHQTAAFTPGVPEPGMDMAGPETPQRKQAFGMMPGMSGPGLNPPGMGSA